MADDLALLLLAALLAFPLAVMVVSGLRWLRQTPAERRAERDWARDEHEGGDW